MNLRYKFKIIPTTLFLIGGKKLGSEYIKSLNYIPGGVLRAALSKDITSRCPYYDDKTSEKKNWVEFKNEKDCSTCKVKNICKNFDKIIISNSYPLNSNIYPLSAMGCKDVSEHEPFDTLAEKINIKLSQDSEDDKKYIPDYSCSEKGCSSRTERHDGFYVIKNEKLEDIESIYEIVTKNSINPYTRTSRDGVLYTLDCHSKFVLEGNEQKQVYFEGYIEGENLENDLKQFDDIYVGAYTTSGLGKMNFKYENIEKEDSKEDLIKRINKFNSFINCSDKVFIPITFLSDCYCKIENYYNKPLYDISTKEYIDMIKTKLNELMDVGDIYYSILSIDMVRGFDTSSKVSRKRALKKIIKAGSVLILETKKNKINYDKLLQIEKSGIGDNLIHGFGQVSVCNRFHIDKYKRKEVR